MLDYCFGQILDIITRLNENKIQHAPQLHQICISTANVLIQNGNYAVKPINSMTNKMFKMSDGYLNDMQLPATSEEAKHARAVINKTFDAYRRKKEAAASSEMMKANIAQS